MGKEEEEMTIHLATHEDDRQNVDRQFDGHIAAGEFHGWRGRKFVQYVERNESKPLYRAKTVVGTSDLASNCVRDLEHGMSQASRWSVGEGRTMCHSDRIVIDKCGINLKLTAKQRSHALKLY